MSRHLNDRTYCSYYKPLHHLLIYSFHYGISKVYIQLCLHMNVFH